MFHPIIFDLHTTNPDQRNASAPRLIQNMPTISEALQVGSLNFGLAQPTVLGWHNVKLQGCGPGEGFTGTITMQTPNNPDISPRGPIEFRNENIRAAIRIFQRRYTGL